MMTIPPEMMDFIHNANATCTKCVQQANQTRGRDLLRTPQLSCSASATMMPAGPEAQ
jgi:hypothetical protein